MSVKLDNDVLVLSLPTATDSKICKRSNVMFRQQGVEHLIYIRVSRRKSTPNIHTASKAGETVGDL